MMLIKEWVYRLGFRPKIGNILHSPSLSLIYAFKDAGVDVSITKKENS